MSKKKVPSELLIPQERIAERIYFIRDQKVMLDEDLAELYGVAPKRLNEQVTRNIDRFPEDFMFRLSGEESGALRSQNATLKGHLILTLKCPSPRCRTKNYTKIRA